MSESGWIAVDLDGTLAEYHGWQGVDHVGAPVKLMVDRVKRWIAEGKDVRIFTARMHGHGMPDLQGGIVDVKQPIEKWCARHLGRVLPVTNIKDFGMIELWDDRAIQVVPNHGYRVDGKEDGCGRG
jgi:hypothetical protein